MELRDSHIFDKQEEGHYVEPLELDRHLAERFKAFLHPTSPILDPCCGFGRIPLAFAQAGYKFCHGRDIVPRWNYEFDGPFPDACKFKVADYFTTDYYGYDAIITNPPFDHTQRVIEKAIREARRLVAVIVPATWINGEGTAKWIKQTRPYSYMPIAPRPSMPPGDYLLEGHAPGGGRKDYGVLLWQKGYVGEPMVDWLLWKEKH